MILTPLEWLTFVNGPMVIMNVAGMLIAASIHDEKSAWFCFRLNVFALFWTVVAVFMNSLSVVNT